MRPMSCYFKYSMFRKINFFTEVKLWWALLYTEVLVDMHGHPRLSDKENIQC